MCETGSEVKTSSMVSFDGPSNKTSQFKHIIVYQMLHLLMGHLSLTEELSQIF